MKRELFGGRLPEREDMALESYSFGEQDVILTQTCATLAACELRGRFDL